MSDMYREILVKKSKTPKDKMIQGTLIVFLVLLLAAGIMVHPILLLAGIVIGIVSFVFVFPKLDVEYEYLYVNGELDIDAIYSKQKRKKLASYDMNELEILAPTVSHALDSYVHKNLKVRDYTSANEKEKSYTLVFNRDKGQEIIKAELDDMVISDIRRIAPRKVNLQ